MEKHTRELKTLHATGTVGPVQAAKHRECRGSYIGGCGPGAGEGGGGGDGEGGDGGDGGDGGGDGDGGCPDHLNAPVLVFVSKVTTAPALNVRV